MDQNSDSSNATSRPSPYIGIVFLLFTALIIFITIFYYYLRERCHSRRRQLLLRLAASSSLAPASHRNIEGGGGLDAALVKAFPELTYSEAKSKYVSVGADCAVCLSAFEDHETLRLLPKCGHVFHPDCVGAWLASHTTCPCCRADLVSVVVEKEASNDVVVDVERA